MIMKTALDYEHAVKAAIALGNDNDTTACITGGLGKIYIVTHGQDESSPFVPVDVTREAIGYYKWINDYIWDLNRQQKETEEIQIPPGSSVLTLMNVGTIGIVIKSCRDNKNKISYNYHSYNYDVYGL